MYFLKAHRLLTTRGPAPWPPAPSGRKAAPPFDPPSRQAAGPGRGGRFSRGMSSLACCQVGGPCPFNGGRCGRRPPIGRGRLATCRAPRRGGGGAPLFVQLRRDRRLAASGGDGPPERAGVRACGAEISTGIAFTRLPPRFPFPRPPAGEQGGGQSRRQRSHGHRNRGPNSPAGPSFFLA